MYRNTIRIMRGIGMAAAVSLAVAACTDAPKSSALRASAATERKSDLTPAESNCGRVPRKSGKSISP